MYRSILIPLNGSRFAEAALPIASYLARAASSHLHLVLAHQPVAAFAGMGELVVPPTNLDEDLRIQENTYLADTAADLVLAGADPVMYREVDGLAGPAVCEEAVRLGADLVVMATHGRSAAGRLWHGSVADYVVRHLTIPVVLVHPDRTNTLLAGTAIQGILVALDLSEDSEAILEPVAELARITQSPVTLIHVVMEPVFEAGKSAEAQRRLDRTAGWLRASGLGVSTRVATGINVAWTLRDALNESQFDLMAMATHGAGGLRRLWLGSVADTVVRSASKPVLVLRPRASAGRTP